MNIEQNPFHFGKPVKKEHYFPQPKFFQLMEQFVESKIGVVITGPRRFGKTSFILNFLEKKRNQNKECLYIDIFNITSHKDFLIQILRALNSESSWQYKLKDFIGKIPRLRPIIQMEPDQNTGQFSFSLSASVTNDRDIKDIIQDIILSFGDIGQDVIVVFDEFQKIAQIDDDGWLEATLRTHMQQLDNVAFIFTGSRRHIISDMLNNETRTFYRSCQ